MNSINGSVMPTDGQIGTPSGSILIVARPGRRREILQAVLKSMNRSNTINVADYPPSVLKLIAQHQPDLIVLDAKLFNDEIWPLLGQIKANWPQPSCLVMVDNNQQQGMAEAAQADKVLLNGLSVTELFTAIDEILL